MTLDMNLGRRMRAVVRAVCCAGLILAIRTAVTTAVGQEPQRGRQVVSKSGMVVSVSAPASEVGLDVLKAGGNAVDGAVATAFALAVTYPAAGNIGGGGFMLVHPGAGGGDPVVIDYRETAPAAADASLFAHGGAPGLKVVGVPGTVRGLAEAHRRFGKRPWRDVVIPAVRLARVGFDLEETTAGLLNEVLRSSPRDKFPELHRVFGKPGGGAWRRADRLVQPDLARTLERIAEDGPDAFYTGEIARKVVDEVKSGGGVMTLADLDDYCVKVRSPVHTTYRGFDVFAPGAPAGGVCLIELLNILENFDLRSSGRWSPATLHLILESMKRAYADRARFLGDPDFNSIPKDLTSKDHAARLARSIDPQKATRSEDLAGDIPLADGGSETTHFSIVDRDGMAVSNTYTLEQMHGARVVVKGGGFLLNDEMGDFNARPGYTDRRGAIGTPPNLVGPRKRMLSSMTPTILSKNGKVVLVTGSPGGRTIINTVLMVVLNVAEFRMDPRAAVDASRMHHQWFPDLVSFEPGAHEEHAEALRALEAMGHKIAPRRAVQGDAHTIWIDPETDLRHGVADRRRRGTACGY